MLRFSLERGMSLHTISESDMSDLQSRATNLIIRILPHILPTYLVIMKADQAPELAPNLQPLMPPEGLSAPPQHSVAEPPWLTSLNLMIGHSQVAALQAQVKHRAVIHQKEIDPPSFLLVITLLIAHQIRCRLRTDLQGPYHRSLPTFQPSTSPDFVSGQHFQDILFTVYCKSIVIT